MTSPEQDPLELSKDEIRRLGYQVVDLLADALDIEVGSWMSATGPTQVELTVLDWFKDWIGYQQTAAGVLVSGGSAANLTALACARE